MAANHPAAVISGANRQSEKPNDGIWRKQMFVLVMGNDGVWVGSRHRPAQAMAGGSSRFVFQTLYAETEAIVVTN